MKEFFQEVEKAIYKGRFVIGIVCVFSFIYDIASGRGVVQALTATLVLFAMIWLGAAVAIFIGWQIKPPPARNQRSDDLKRLEADLMSLPPDVLDKLLTKYERRAAQQAHQGDGANAPPDSK